MQEDRQGDFDTYEQDGWVYAPNIPIFDEHERDGVHFDEATLRRIADNCNRRIADTGDEVPLTLGHTDAPAREVLGWASNFKVGTWGKVSPRPCIFADFKFPADKWQVAREFPRRSVELWEPGNDTSYIDPIALLGATTPMRDLGLLYQKNNTGRNTYRYELSGGTLNKDELAKCFAEMLEESDIGKYVRSQMDQADDDHEDEDVEANAADEQDDHEEEPRDDEDEKEKLKEQRDQFARRYARLEADHKTLSSRLADIERKERLASRKAALLSVEAEGVLFDMAEELDTAKDLGDSDFDKHVDKMRKRYSRSPIGVKVQPASMPEHGAGLKSELTPEQVRQAAELITSGKARNTEEAFSMVRG